MNNNLKCYIFHRREFTFYDSSTELEDNKGSKDSETPVLREG